ncbi:RidA family protein [Phycisphaerales bacterium AB-hyl4]|uniref:RidA family protein n=1 Tax=Natronomicrosphaera hydrolytica TaxID=3242702 RepID=A0ABV4U8U8_9BACT
MDATIQPQCKAPVFPNGQDTSVAPYSPGLRVGPWVFVSGQGPLNFETMRFETDRGIEHEARLTLENVRSVLEAAGCKLTDVVKVTVYLQNMNDFVRFNEVYKQVFAEPWPARTAVQAVLGAGISIEIDAIAIAGCGSDGA